MGTTADKLNRLLETKTAIKEAIKGKEVPVSDADSFRSYAEKIMSIPQERRTPDKKSDVTFYDYDGIVLHSYTKEAFLALAEMPELPTRVGLICQGWNYELEDARAYVEEYGVLDVGATYITDDGKTRLYITIAAKGRMKVPIYFMQTEANGVVVDWGDGSEAQTYNSTTVNATHSYDSIGDYVITLEVVSGQLKFEGTSHKGIVGGEEFSAYQKMLKKVEIGNGVTDIGELAFSKCYSLSSVVIPNSVTSIENGAFANCVLSSVIIPNSVTYISSYAFLNCYSLSLLVIGNSVTRINGNAFESCYSLASVVIPNSVTSMGNWAFANCYFLSSVVIGSNVKIINGNAFLNCYSLSLLVIGNSVTRINGNAFESCYSLASVVIPNSVTSIGSDAFKHCKSVALYDFSACESRVGLGTNAFYDIAGDCKIIVPDALYVSWKTAENWSTYASQIVKASEYNG